MNKENYITSAPIPELIKKIAIPASVGFFFNTMLNVTDTFYGGLVSSEAVAALSLSFPVFFTIIALGSGISTGSSALITNALGAGDEKKAKLYGMQAISFSVIISFFLMFFGLFFSPAFARILGAEGEYLNITLSYINIIFLGTVFFLLTFVLNSLLTARGNTKTFRNFLIIGFLLNLILDPWFIFGWLGFPALGLPGVAWATVLIQFIGVIFYFFKLKKEGILCDEKLKNIIPQKKIYWEIFKQGSPASLNSLTVAVGIFIITYFISRFGKNAVAAYGIATRVEQMALIPNIGLNIATLTLVGQNFGAKKFDRLKETFSKALWYGISLVSVGMALVYLFAEYIFRAFTRDLETISIGVGYVHIGVFIYWAYIILYVSVSALQGIKRPAFALYIGLFRQIVAPVLVFYFFTQILNLGIKGIWWGIFLVNWLAVIVTIFYIRSTMRKVGIKEIIEF